MRQLVLLAHFKGTGTSLEEGRSLALNARADTLTQIPPETIAGEPLEWRAGESAVLASTLTMLGDTRFREIGTISFEPGPDRLSFKTASEGHVGPSPDASVTCGASVAWISGGEGQLQGASGYLSSTFSLRAYGEYDEYWHALVLLP